jgi:hypothetical protein
MNDFFPFIHKIKRKNKQEELQPLYIEMYPPQLQEEEKIKEEEPTVIIIEL